MEDLEKIIQIMETNFELGLNLAVGQDVSIADIVTWLLEDYHRINLIPGFIRPKYNQEVVSDIILRQRPYKYFDKNRTRHEYTHKQFTTRLNGYLSCIARNKTQLK